MPPRWDDLLHELPVEAMPAGLTAQVRLRLKAARARESRQQAGLDAIMAAVFLFGLTVLVPQLAGAGEALSGGSVESAWVWVSQLGRAPASAIWSSLTGAADWTGHLAGAFGIAGLLGLALTSVPLFVWLRRMMPEGGFVPDAANLWPASMSEEGAGG